MTITEHADFAATYGPWALVLGASEGVGTAFAHAAAERGLNLLLVARRQAPLEALATEIRSSYGVEAIALALDLTGASAAQQIIDAATGREVGILVYCAGADASHDHFLDQPLADALALVQRNCVVPLQLCHHFASPMRARGHGGIVMLSSGGGLVGGANMVAYGATKAFDIVMTEALWAELSPHGVDVLALVLGATDTPALRRTLAARGLLDDPASTAPIQGVATVADVISDLFANLGQGPTVFVGERMRESAARIGAMDRNTAVRALAQATGGTMHTKQQTS